jgi:hypothetical protein
MRGVEVQLSRIYAIVYRFRHTATQPQVINVGDDAAAVSVVVGHLKWREPKPTRFVSTGALSK